MAVRPQNHKEKKSIEAITMWCFLVFGIFLLWSWWSVTDDPILQVCMNMCVFWQRDMGAEDVDRIIKHDWIMMNSKCKQRAHLAKGVLWPHTYTQPEVFYSLPHTHFKIMRLPRPIHMHIFMKMCTGMHKCAYKKDTNRIPYVAHCNVSVKSCIVRFGLPQLPHTDVRVHPHKYTRKHM